MYKKGKSQVCNQLSAHAHTNCVCTVVKHGGNLTKNPSSNLGKNNGGPGAALVYAKCG